MTYANGVYLPPGFGFLIPRDQDVPIIACTFVHNKFDHRVPKGSGLLRLFMKDAIDWPDEQIRTTVKQRLAAILRITAEPSGLRIFRWPRSMPQYEVGHLQRVSAIEQLVTPHERMQLIGNAYRGIGVPDCVREGKQAAEKAITTGTTA